MGMEDFGGGENGVASRLEMSSEHGFEHIWENGVASRLEMSLGARIGGWKGWCPDLNAETP